MKPCQADWQKLVNTEILFCYTPNEAMSGRLAKACNH